MKTTEQAVTPAEQLRIKALYAEWECERLEKARERELEETLANEERDIVLKSSMAAVWRADYRRKISNADLSIWKSSAILATIEALTRKSKSWGWMRSHTSASRGRADSRYLEKNGTQVRLSNHELPMTHEREYRYATNGGPTWTEIIVTDEQLKWSLTKWRRIFLLAEHGRYISQWF